MHHARTTTSSCKPLCRIDVSGEGAGVRLLLLSHWGHAEEAAPGELPPARALTAVLRGHPTLRQLDLDDGTFTTAGAPLLER